MKRFTPPYSLFLLVTLLFVQAGAFSQEKKVKLACIAFYNVENLFDTFDDPKINDEEFLPEGPNGWDTQRYREKLGRLAEVISQIGDDYMPGGPMILGLSEIENKQVLEDLIKTAPLDKSGYGIVHYDSPDRRGVDVGLIYKTKYFRVTDSKSVRLTLPSDTAWKTRDILVVSGVLEGEPLHILVNHWPSRSGGQAETVAKRNAAADLCRATAMSIQEKDPNAKIIIMGDLNDDPVDESLVKHLKAKGKIQDVKPGDLFNPMWQLYRDGIGSLAYKDSWNLFDQIIVSSPLVDKSKGGYQFFKAMIFNKKFLLQNEGAYKGYPYRTFAGGVYQGGYSDHLPACIFLVKEVQ